MGHPESHVVQPQLTKGAVQVHFQSRCLPGQGGVPVPIGVIGTGTQILRIVAVGLGARCRQRQGERPGIEDGRFGVGHGQQHGHAACQCRGCAGVPVFLVRLAGFTQVDVRIDQSR